jgi:hypothetical protein
MFVLVSLCWRNEKAFQLAYSTFKGSYDMSERLNLSRNKSYSLIHEDLMQDRIF